MRQACARFEQYLKRRFGQSSTPKHYISDLNIFLRTVGHEDAEEVTTEDIDGFVGQQIAAGLSPATINRRLSFLHSFFEFPAAEQPEQTWPNPVVNRRYQLKTGSHLPRDASDGDITRLFGTITDERDLAIFGLMVGAGLRVGEVAELRLDSVEAPGSVDEMAKLRIRGKGNKERMVWLTSSLWNAQRAWLEVRSPTDDDHLFLNCHGRPISVAGIRYRLKQHCEAAGVTLSCHQSSHTFVRCLAENGLPVDSLAKLLGHSQLQTAQRYIDGADPVVRADFSAAMAHLEIIYWREQDQAPDPPQPSSSSRPRTASQAELEKVREHLTELPPWLGEGVDIYLRWYWPTWPARSAYDLGINLLSLMRRIGTWLTMHRQVEVWDTFRRVDLEAWIQARQQDGVSDVTVRNELGRLRGLLKFLEPRGYPLDPGLFRVKPPKRRTDPLPRYLSEADYRRLETTIWREREIDTYHARFDRAWFLTLAHTGVRISELLDLRLGDLNLKMGYATVRGGKSGKDRVAYLTPPLTHALKRYLQVRLDLPDDDHVFVLRRGSPATRTMQRRLTRYGKQAGVVVSPHRLRHTLATRLINQDMPIHSLRKLLGHEHLNTTQIYARIYEETLHGQFEEVWRPFQ